VAIRALRWYSTKASSDAPFGWGAMCDQLSDSDARTCPNPPRCQLPRPILHSAPAICFVGPRWTRLPVLRKSDLYIGVSVGFWGSGMCGQGQLKVSEKFCRLTGHDLVWFRAGNARYTGKACRVESHATHVFGNIVIIHRSVLSELNIKQIMRWKK